MQRRLTTILIADVVGYSRLMEVDEQGTFETLQKHLNEAILPQIAERGGDVIKHMGDGLLAEFASVVDAVNCAMAIQRDMAERVRDVREDRRIVFRIGVHLGDVISEDGDIHGDGVNVAARLETLAEPGTIAISRAVLDQVENRIDVGLRDLGPSHVKNISRPIHAYLLNPSEPGAVRSMPPRTRRRLVLPVLAVLLLALGGIAFWQFAPRDQGRADIAIVRREADSLPGLAVLPFENLSGTSDQDYLADGITQDLITDLAKVSGLIVISRESSFTFRDSQSNPTHVAEDLGVRYVVKGSLRRAGNRIRINAQLIDSETGAHIWAERYDREMEDIFALQDDVRTRIVAALQVELTPEEAETLAQSLTDNPAAYDAYLRALQQESYFTKEGTEAAIRYYHEALALDPGFTVARARLATVYTVLADFNWSPDLQATLELALNLAREAVAQNANLPIAHWAMARVYTRDEYWDTDKAIASLRRAIEIDPNYADAYAMLGNTLQFAGRAEEGIEQVETAMRLNPHFPFWYHFALGANQFQLTRYDAAKASFENAIARNPSWRSSYRFLISTLGHLGERDDAEWQMEELRALGFDATLSTWPSKYQDAIYRERFFEGLRKAGIPET